MAQQLRSLVAFPEPNFSRQHPHGSSPLAVSLVAEDLPPSSGLCGHCTHMMHKHEGRQKTHTHKIKINPIKGTRSVVREGAAQRV